MRQRKNGLRLLGLLAVAALAVMAFASSAQAHKFLVNKTFLLASVGAKLETGTVGTMLVPGLSFQLSCKKMAVTKGLIETAADGEGEFSYTECTTLKIKTAEELPCHVKEPILASALFLPTLTTGGKLAILAEKIKALILLHSNKITPEWPLGTLPCILPLDNTVVGELCLEITGGNDTSLVLVVSDDTTQEKCDPRVTLEGVEGGTVKDALKYGAQPATIDGKAEVFLTGATHEGLSLGVSA
jgi:hypothetical protein